MDSRSLGSRGSLYLNLQENLETFQDAPEAIEVFSKGKGGGRDRQPRRASRGPIGIQIDASQFETFGNDSYLEDDLEKLDGSFASLDHSENLNEPIDNMGDYDEGAVYGEFELKGDDDDDMDLKPAARKEPRSGGTRLAQYEEDGRSVGSKSAKSTKSVHTNPGVLKNDRAPRAKKAAPQQKSAAERLSQFNTMTARRSVGSVHSSGANTTGTTHAERRRSREAQDMGECGLAAAGNATSQMEKDNAPEAAYHTSQYNQSGLAEDLVPRSPVEVGNSPAADYNNTIFPRTLAAHSVPGPTTVGAHHEFRNPNLAADYKAQFSYTPVARPELSHVRAYHDAQNQMGPNYQNTFASGTANQPEQTQGGARHDFRHPSQAQYSNEVPFGTPAQHVQSLKGAYNDTRNYLPFDVNYATSPGMARSSLPTQNSITSSPREMPLHPPIPPRVQGGSSSMINEAVRGPKGMAPKSFVPPSSGFIPPSHLQGPHSLVSSPVVQPPGTDERRKFENALKNLHSNTVRRSGNQALPISPPPPALRASCPPENQRSPHLMDPFLHNQGNSPIPTNPSDFRSGNSKAVRTSALPEYSKISPTAAKDHPPSSSWGKSPFAVDSQSHGWGRNPLEAPVSTTVAKHGKARSKNQSLPSMQPLEMPPCLSSPMKKEAAKKKSSKSADPNEGDDPFLAKPPPRTNSNGSLGRMFGKLLTGRTRDKKS